MDASIARDLTDGPVMSSMLAFALPMIAGNLLQQCYNVVDTAVVGRYLGNEALAAVGSSFSLMTFITSILLGMCMGSGALFSMEFGNGDKKELSESIFASFVLILLMTGALTAACFALLDTVEIFLRIPSDVWPDMRRYLLMVFVGVPATFAYNFYACLLRALGNSRTPLLFLVLSAATNIALDLCFVAVLGWGVASAAAATVLSQYVAAGGIIWYTRMRAPEYLASRNRQPVTRRCLGRIASFSFLTCVQQSVMNLGILLVQGVVNGFGVTVMAAFAAGVKIDAFAYAPAQDFGNAFSTFIAQNFGAARNDRIRAAIRGALVTTVTFCCGVSLLVCLFAPQLLEVFIKPGTPEVAVGSEYLRIEGAFYFGIGVLFLLYGLFRAIGHPGVSVVLTVLSLGTRVTLSYLLSPLPSLGEAGIWWSVPIGWILADIVGLLLYLARRGTLLAHGEAREMTQSWSASHPPKA